MNKNKSAETTTTHHQQDARQSDRQTDGRTGQARAEGERFFNLLSFLALLSLTILPGQYHKSQNHLSFYSSSSSSSSSLSLSSLSNNLQLQYSPLCWLFPMLLTIPGRGSPIRFSLYFCPLVYNIFFSAGSNYKPTPCRP